MPWIQSSYAKILVITQSSGMGKSKTVDTIARERILFPLCMREDLGENSFGAWHGQLYINCSLMSKNLAFPPSDNAVRDFFLRAPSAGERDRCKNYMRAFLVSLFDAVRAQIIEKCKTPGRKMKYQELATHFYDYFLDQDMRNTFYGAVIAESEHRGTADQKEASDAL